MAWFITNHNTKHHRRYNLLHPYIKYPHAAQAHAWDIVALARAYNWPTNAPGGGSVAIPELGGGYISADIAQFCKMYNIPFPTIVDHSVNGGRNSGNPKEDASGEVALDIQTVIASYFAATGKPAHIHMYFGPNDDTAIAACTTQAAIDRHDVIPWSWGADEANTGVAGCMAAEVAAFNAVHAGAVVLAAAGDNDSSDGGPTPANVDSPASCPHVIACGGTRKTKTDETVWNNNPHNPDGSGTGGGFSMLFPMPMWMSGAPHGRRMVPDLAANADPVTGVKIVLDGQVLVIGGTSFVAPFIGGLIAACGPKRGLLTHDGIGPLIWSHHMAFTDVTKGDNGLYRAKIGPDACTGLGVPNGTKLANLLING
jgi:subtilase family serine protease